MKHNLMPYAELLHELEERDRMLGDAMVVINNLVVSGNSVAYCYTKRPGNFAAALQSLSDDARNGQAFLAAYDASKTAGKDGA